MTISSVVVQTRPEFMDGVINSLKENNHLCEYHLNDEAGRIIITVEGESTDEEINKLGHIQRLPHIISAEMMYSYSEDELEKLRENVGGKTQPNWLNKENIDAKNIVYNGDLKKRF